MSWLDWRMGGVVVNSKPLSEMNLEELWMLFPIILCPHNPAYAQWYDAARTALLSSLAPDAVARISHIGSTAVAGLVAKPTVDILLELTADYSVAAASRDIVDNGWLLMSSVYEPDLKQVYNKGYTPEVFAERVYHLHVRRLGDWDELYFRDYLIAHSDVAAEYGSLKLSLHKPYEHDRNGYTEAKTDFIRQKTIAARLEFPRRYAID